MTVSKIAGLTWIVVAVVTMIWGEQWHVWASAAISALWLASDEIILAIRESRE